MEIHRKGISEQVADKIKERIQAGIYKVDERIPGERDMALELSVSRNTVREAYKILEAYGYLTAKHGTGVFVASPEHQIKKMAEAFFVSTDQIKDFFSVRKLMEESTVKWAIENSESDEFLELDEIVNEAIKMVEEDEKGSLRLSELDHKFHLTLANYSKNVVLIRIMNYLVDLLSESRTKSMMIPGRARQSVQEHIKILEAIKQKDIPLAQQYMREHLESVEKSITQERL
jgi:GntR family transcriptional regulator, transcriptional repressor for pyruvate dehydrogenase complex